MSDLIEFMQKSGFGAEVVPAGRLGIALLVGGILSTYVQFLYHRFGEATYGGTSVRQVFTVLTLVTIGVIWVVKSSLALSLGLVGALSIVRFRAAIKDPNELVYLFLCIGIGLSLGAGHVLAAAALVFVVSLYVIGKSVLFTKSRSHDLLLTIIGETEKYFENYDSSALSIVRRHVERFKLQRLDMEDDRGLLKVLLSKMSDDEVASLITVLRESLPGCHISYINIEATL